MNCPHGKSELETCTARGCVQAAFEHTWRRVTVAIRAIKCDTCGRGVGYHGKDVRRGLSASTIRFFFLKHLPPHETYWKAIDVDSRAEILGRGVPPIAVDSDQPGDQLPW